MLLMFLSLVAIKTNAVSFELLMPITTAFQQSKHTNIALEQMVIAWFLLHDGEE